jgi:hypothetical protein
LRMVDSISCTTLIAMISNLSLDLLQTISSNA